MKLLVIASIPQISTANYFVAAFKRSGHELLVCSDIAGPQVDLVATGLVDADAVMRKHFFAADAVVFFEGGSMRLLPDTSKVKSCPTAWYAIDTHMDFDKHVHIGRIFDMSFVAQKQYLPALTEAGVRHAQWMPLAFAPELAPVEPMEKNIDIAYVGSENADMHPHRSALLNALRAVFASTHFGRATPLDMGRIYASAKLVFNRSINNDVNMRFFEAMGAGAVLLSDRIVDNGVEDLFEEGYHYLTYCDEHDLVRLVRELLVNPIRMQQIGDAARSRVMSAHTYQHRADELVSKLQTAAKRTCPSPSDVFAACVSLGLTADALRLAGTAVATVGGGRFQRILGASSAMCLRILAAIVAGADHLRRAASSRRHA
jgi:glycosyltransferase involved in cell wall biosynthesis